MKAESPDSVPMVLVPLPVVLGMEQEIVRLHRKVQKLEATLQPITPEDELRAERAMRSELARYRYVAGAGFILASPLPPAPDKP